VIEEEAAERTSVQDEKAVEAAIEVIAEIVTVDIKAEGLQIVTDPKATMKTVGTKIQVIAPDLHTEIRTDFKLKSIG
jgi:hypothetical protein